MALRDTGPLVRELGRALPERPFAVELWDGGRLEPTEPGGPTLLVRSPQAIAHLLRAPGQLGLGRAYVSGALAADDLDAVVALIGRWQPPPLDARAKARLALAGLRAMGPVRPPRIPAVEHRPRGRLHSLRRDAQAVRHHYDAGNDFFALFLDDSMTYSCALFSRGARTLEEAQEAKLELVCSKLGLEPGMRVLDVGCGWGSFAIHAARRHGVEALGITLSPRQAELARERVAAAGLADRVEIRVADWRELADDSFDAVASIGMVEHVGEASIDAYARRLFELLRPGGTLLNHGIARLGSRPPEGGPFSERYVFPDGAVLPLARVLLALERAGFHPDHVEGLAADYAETLRHWIERFDARLDDAVRIAGAERVRVWRLYLRAARNGFLTGLTSVFQVRCRRPAAEAPPTAARRPRARPAVPAAAPAAPRRPAPAASPPAAGRR